MKKSRLLKRLSVRRHLRRSAASSKNNIGQEQCPLEKDDGSSHESLEQDQSGHDSLHGVPRIVTTSDMPTPSPIRECAMTEYKQHQQADRIAKAAAALDNYGNTLFEQGEYGNAMASYSKALRLKKRTLRTLHDDGSSHDDSNAYPSAAVAKSESALMASVATSINNIGYLRQRGGAGADETMAAYKDSLRIKTQILGRDSLSVGKTLNNIGSVHFLTKSYDKAMEAYREAHAILSFNLGRSHLDVATVVSNIGDVYLARRDVETASDKYREALSIRWEKLGEHDPRVERLLQKIALIEMGELKQAEELGVASAQKEEEEDADIQAPFDSLRMEVKEDMRHIDNVKRQLAIDMVKEKLQMRREIRAMDEGVEIIGGSDSEKPHSPSRAPLSPSDRAHALLSIKERVASLRQLRLDDEESSNDKNDLNNTAEVAPRKNPDALRHLDTNTVSGDPESTDETDKERLERLRESSKRRYEQRREDQLAALGQSKKERAMERHRLATENVKERLERLRAKHRMRATCVKFERDGIDALLRVNVDLADTKSAPVEM